MTPLQWVVAAVVALTVATWALVVPIRLMPAPRPTIGAVLKTALAIDVILILLFCIAIPSLLFVALYMLPGARLSTGDLLGVAWIVLAGAAVIGLIELGVRLYVALSHRDLRAEREQAQARTARKVEAIRRYREEHNVGLWEAKQAADAMERDGTLN